MVARVDAALRDELGIASGLADPRVHVLDPCTGTGSFLVEVLRRIHRTLAARGADALLAHDLKRAAMERVHGFEILPAPFVVAHLQLGLLLQNLGAPLAGDGTERASVYLTNALTGWERTPEARQVAYLPELAEERDAAAHVKRDERILVVIGNPPYNGFAGVGVAEERLLSDAYRTATRTKQPQGQGLNDLYVRFYRMAERRIVEQTGEGIVCLISNYSWLDGLSFTAMRERFLEEFDEIRIDCLNGDKYKTGKLTPEGKPDPSIFSTERNREGIQVGTAIALGVRQRRNAQVSRVQFRHLWGKGKLAQLHADANRPTDRLGYQGIAPPVTLGLPLLPMTTTQGYAEWPPLPSLFPTSFPDVKTSRDDVVVDIDRVRLVERMERYFDPKIGNEQLRRLMPGAMEDSGRFDADAVRSRLLKRGFLPDKVVPYFYRPFDMRWLYWEPETDLIDRRREDFFAQVFPGNLWIEARQKQTRPFDRGIVTRYLADNQGNGLSTFFPLYRRPSLFDQRADGLASNLSEAAHRYLVTVDGRVEDLFFHAVAILNTPVYRTQNDGPLRQDWPRVPLPTMREALRSSAELGRRIADRLDLDASVTGVTAEPFRPEYRLIAPVSSVDGRPLDPSAGDLALTVGWGHPGQGRTVMPGQGKPVKRDFTAAEHQTIRSAVNPLGLVVEGAPGTLGGMTYDVFLNDRAYWSNVPAAVWNYTIGGYPVLKKWLSYREADLLGRPLRGEEARLFTTIARRIAAILLLQPELDANYREVIGSTFDWSRVAKPAATLSLWGS